MASGDTTPALVTAQGGATYVAGPTWTAGQIQLACDLANASVPYPYGEDSERELVTTLYALHALDVQADAMISPCDVPQLPHLDNVEVNLMSSLIVWREVRSWLCTTRWGQMAAQLVMRRTFGWYFGE